MGDDGTEQPATLGRRALIRGTATLVAAGGVATTTNAADGPTAAFVLDPERPDPGESATLDATPSQGSGTPITRYEWEVDGRARPASGREVFQTWRDPGLYQVTLTVTDGDGRSDTTQRYVEVFNEPPTPAFETDPSDVEAGRPVTLDASTANDPDGRIVDYEWELTGSDGGTETASGETTTVTWEDDGTVTVRLTVVDDGGAERSLTEELWVGNRTPGAACAVQTDDPVQYEPVTVDGTLSVDRDGDVVDYEWAYETAFGTQYATGPTIQHAFQQPGTYRFELTVTDDDGATDTAWTTAEVRAAEESGEPAAETPTRTESPTAVEGPAETTAESPTTTQAPAETATTESTTTRSPATTESTTQAPTAQTPALTTTEVTETTGGSPTATTPAESTREVQRPTGGDGGAPFDPAPSTAASGAGGSDEGGDGSIGVFETVTAGIAVAAGVVLYRNRSDDDGDADGGPSPSAGGGTPAASGGGKVAGTDGGTPTAAESPTAVGGTETTDPESHGTDAWAPEDPTSWSADGTGSASGGASAGDDGTSAASTASSEKVVGTVPEDADAGGSTVAESDSEDTDDRNGDGEAGAADDGGEPSERLAVGPAGVVTAMGSEDGAAGFVESVPAVESAELVSAGPLYKYRGSMANGPDDVWFWTVDPASVGDDAVTAAFEDRVGEWAAIDDARYVASVAAYDTEPRPWVAVLAAESTVGNMDHSLPRRQCRAVVDGVTRALQAAADAGVAHYTLSPDHVHVVEDGEPAAVVSDWGLEAAVAEAAGRERAPTPYDAPEQVYGDDSTEATTVYRLGAVSYHALTAARPAEAYQFDPDYDLERTIIDRQYTPVTRHDSSLRPAVDAVLKQAMEPNPDARYDSTDLFRKSLNGSL